MMPALLQWRAQSEFWCHSSWPQTKLLAPEVRGATHKEKFNVPLSEDHKDLFKFQKYLKTFTGLDDIARSKGLGENPEVTIARVKKASSGSGVETFSLRTQDAWQYEFETLIQGNGMLQGTCNYILLCIR